MKRQFSDDFEFVQKKKRRIHENPKNKIPKQNSIQYEIKDIEQNLQGVSIINNNNNNNNIDIFDQDLYSNADDMDCIDYINDEFKYQTSPSNDSQLPLSYGYICCVHNNDKTICNIYDCYGIKFPKKNYDFYKSNGYSTSYIN